MKLTEDDFQCVYAEHECNCGWEWQEPRGELLVKQILENQEIVEKIKELLHSQQPFDNNSSRDWFAEIWSIIPKEPCPLWAYNEWPDLQKLVDKTKGRNS